MPQFTCPSCHAVLRAPQALQAGTKIRCKKCGQSFRVPIAPLPVAQAVLAVPVALPSEAREPRRRWMVIGGIVGGGVVLVLVAVLVYFLNKPQAAPEGGPGGKESGEVAKGKPPKDRKTSGPVRPPPEPPRPVFTLSGNGEGKLRLFQSWPLLVHGQLLHPQAFARDEKVEPMVLAATDGPWTGSVRLEVRDAKGKKVDWPWHLATAAKPKVTLDNKTSGYVAWWLTAEETAAIPPGDYQLIGIVDTKSAKAPDLWKGSASSRPVKIQVAAEPKPLFTEQQEKKSLLMAHLTQLRGDPKQALVQVEALLTRQPKSLAGLELKGDLLAESGQTEAALRQYDQALAAYLAVRPRWGEPPQGLLRKHREVLVRFLKK